MDKNLIEHYRNLDTPEFVNNFRYQKDIQNTGKHMIDKLFKFMLED